MTTKIVPRTCDLCGKDIVSEQKYKLQISQRGNVRGKFVKAKNDGDMCHPCFLDFCTKGYKPEWETMIQDPVTKKWEVVAQ